MQVGHFNTDGKITPMRPWPDELAPPKPGDRVKLAYDLEGVVSMIYHDLPQTRTWIIVDFLK